MTESCLFNRIKYCDSCGKGTKETLRFIEERTSPETGARMGHFVCEECYKEYLRGQNKSGIESTKK